ncbi:ABC transporter permease [Paenibacillus sp. Leaf72]|uniref:ABC transporter permease n=1 Tax=Paenibacillus sp. Leaf72 TaxID=1736234 RepID=UPI0007C715A4|nr:ABC-2 family transporter protein [Paenibacillus sp. Leaf72]
MRLHSMYLKTFSLGVQNSLEYRTNFFLNLFGAVFPILIQYFYWRAVFTSSGQQIVFGFSYNQMIAYSVLAVLMSKLIGTTFQYEIARDIKDGGLNKYLVKPIGYLSYRIFCFLGEKSVQMLVVLALSVIVMLLLNAWLDFPVNLSHILLFLCVVPSALMLNFFIYYSLSAVAFWFTEANGAFRTFALLANIAGGGLFPLDIYGPVTKAILLTLPFNYVIYFPIRLLSGMLTGPEIAAGAMMQLVWIGVFAALSTLLWRQGLTKYIAVGG